MRRICERQLQLLINGHFRMTKAEFLFEKSTPKQISYNDVKSKLIRQSPE